MHFTEFAKEPAKWVCKVSWDFLIAGTEAGDGQGWKGEGAGGPLQPEHEPDAGGAPGADTGGRKYYTETQKILTPILVAAGGHMERVSPEADLLGPARADHRVDAVQRVLVSEDGWIMQTRPTSIAAEM